MFAELKDYEKYAQYFEFNGFNIAYWHRATAITDSADTPILFLHGFPSASYDWHRIATDCASLGPVYALDFLGFGLSDKPYPHRYSILEQADIVEAFVAHLGMAQVHIVAHDYAVSVAQELLRRGETDFINSVAFLNGGLFADLHRPIFTQKLLHSPLGSILTKLMTQVTLAKGFTRIFGPDTPPSQPIIDALWQLINTKQGRRLIPCLLDYLDERKTYQRVWRQALIAAPVPLGFINGVADPISGEHMLRAFQALLPDAYSIALNVGHYPQLEDPNSVYLALRKFWQE
jgi:pimeloyl-ACP methyl ester carboxylesterase